jgi:hypothetical protein
MIGKVKDIIEDEEVATVMLVVSLDDARKLWKKIDQEVVIAWVN